MSNCNHPRLRCTDNIFYCLDCGVMVQRPDLAPLAREPTAPTESAEQTAREKPARGRKQQPRARPVKEARTNE